MPVAEGRLRRAFCQDPTSFAGHAGFLTPCPTYPRFGYAS
jgi:hypothetical protein